LEKADLLEAHLEGAKLTASRLEKANFFTAHLEGATLAYTHLEGTNFLDAHLEGAKLDSSHLEGKSFAADDPYWQRIRQWMPDFPATLAPANLRGAYFDAATVLNDAVLVDTQHGAVQVADARWGGVNLAVVPDWSPFTERHIPLGDERVAWAWKAAPFSESEAERKRPRKQRTQTRQDHVARQAQARLDAFQVAVRANRQLATTLRAQGMNEQADYFAYHAQVVQRAVLRQQRKWGRAFGSWLLAVVSGYGYQPVRSIIAYVVIISLFAGAYLLNGQFAAPHLSWDEALVLSISSFHGRGFFSTGITLGDTLARLAAGEAIIGLLIEITFIATFTQRFFAR
jgi:hypothetical protein